MRGCSFKAASPLRSTIYGCYSEFDSRLEKPTCIEKENVNILIRNKQTERKHQFLIFFLSFLIFIFISYEEHVAVKLNPLREKDAAHPNKRPKLIAGTRPQAFLVLNLKNFLRRHTITLFYFPHPQKCQTK